MKLSSQLVTRSTGSGSGSGSASPAPAPAPPTIAPIAPGSTHRPPHPHPSPSPSPSPSPLPENLTHTAQSRLPQSDLSSNPVTVAEASAEQVGFPGYEGLTDEEVFRAVTRPRPRARPGSAGSRTGAGPGVAAGTGTGAGAGAAGTAVTQGEEDWGIPPEVDPNEADEGLKVSRGRSRWCAAVRGAEDVGDATTGGAIKGCEESSCVGWNGQNGWSRRGWTGWLMTTGWIS